MATKKDLVEAYSFSRRRLVTAFVSGAPGGREVEPSRPGRTIIGGVALAVLVAAGGAVAGILGSHTSVDWTQPALVSDKDTGADYVILPTDSDSGTATDPVLRPVANITSAMLLLGSDLTHEVVSGGDIASQKRGAPIGILQAPATPPATDALLQTGWTACTGTVNSKHVGLKVTVSAAPGVQLSASNAEMVVKSDNKTYVIAEATGGLTSPRAYAFQVDAGKATGNVLADVAKVDQSQVLKVSPAFIGLFPPGPSLSAAGFKVKGLGDKVGYLDLPDDKTARVGDYYFSPDTDDDMRVVLADGITRLTPFAAAVYRDTLGSRVKPLGGDIADPAKTSTTQLYDVGTLPDQVASSAPSGQQCAVLQASPGQLPGVQLATTSIGTVASAADVRAGDMQVSVDSGHGAVVDSSSFSTPASSASVGQPFLIDDRGIAYSLAGNARDQLGYTDVAAEDVPDTWIKLFERGVPLSVDAARCPPTSSTKFTACGT